jgi:micrococcal nuclease
MPCLRQRTPHLPTYRSRNGCLGSRVANRFYVPYFLSRLLRCQRLAVVLVSVFSAAPAFSFTGDVVGVLDGDTIKVLHSGKAERIRLQGIDCPEKNQPFGHKAKQATSALVFAKKVTLAIYGKDKYRRILADVLIADGTNVNHELVKEGWCWWYRKFAPGDTELKRLEQDARDAKKGLWADPKRISPWEWRKRK